MSSGTALPPRFRLSRSRPARLAGALAVSVAFASCAGVGVDVPAAGTEARAERVQGQADVRARLVEGASALLGRTELVVKGRRFTADCTGTVLAIYWYAGIDLSEKLGARGAMGVGQIFRGLADRDLLDTSRFPVSGDILFWDNTWDANSNGAWDDPLTHVGMVVSTADDGEISYVHQNVRRGIVIEYMNLRRPAVYQEREWGVLRTLNSPMRLALPGVSHPPLWLSGQLFRASGMAYLL